MQRKKKNILFPELNVVTKIDLQRKKIVGKQLFKDYPAKYIKCVYLIFEFQIDYSNVKISRSNIPII